MTIHRTIDGDMVDAICKAHYGSEAMVATVYEANPGLAAMGAVLPMGIEIKLPDQPDVKPASPIRLWG